jgi:hypothetical protein
MSLAGDLTFNPLTDSLTGADGKQFKLKSPYGDELPARGFDAGEDTYQPPAADGSKVNVVVDPSRCAGSHVATLQARADVFSFSLSLFLSLSW